MEKTTPPASKTGRVLFVLSGDEYVRNYLRTEALQVLEETTTIELVARGDLALLDEVRDHPGFIGTFSVDPAMSKRHQLFFEMLMWRYRKRSRTFLYRWMRIANWDLIRTNQGFWKLVTSFVRWALSSTTNTRALRSPLLGNPLVFPLLGPLLHRSLTPNAELTRLVEQGPFDLIVFPSSAHEPTGSDLIRLGRENNIPTLALIDNWDNLSSKTVLWEKPTHLAVWGEQTRQQAISIHGCEPASVHVLGTPRFDVYLQPRKPSIQKTTASLPDRYLLFVGSAMPFDEIAALHAIEGALTGHKADPQNLRIVYRPHPWQQKRRIPQVFREEDFAYTELDPQLSGNIGDGFRSQADNSAFQPDLNYYPALLSSATVVVGPLTTMLFEAALCHRPVLALAYPDGHHFNTSRRYFAHFDGVENIPGFVFCEQPERLGLALQNLLENPEVDHTASDQATQHYLFRDSGSYPQRLQELVSHIMKG
jgi:hypothetical protein